MARKENQLVTMQHNIEQLEEQARRQAKTKQAVIWVKSSPRSVFYDIATGWKNKANSLVAKPKHLSDESKTGFRRYLDTVRLIADELLDIDRNLLSDKDAATVSIIVSERMPAALRSFTTRYLEYSVPHAWSNYSNTAEVQRFSSIYDTLSSIHQAQLSFSANLSPKFISADVGQFPDFHTDSANVDARINHVGLLWAEAKKSNRSLLSEEEYFLGQVATSYLPDALTLYNSFRYMDADFQAKAEQILLEQVDLIEKHLHTILKTDAKNRLGQMQSQMYFLEEKTKAPTNALQLNRGS